MRTLSLLLLALAACGSPAETAGDEDDAPPRRPAVTTADAPYFILGPQGGAARQYERMPMPARDDTVAIQAWRDSLMARGRRSLGLSRDISVAADWREADAIIQRSLGDNLLVPHNAAVQMLDRHLLRGDLDVDKSEALGRYTEALSTHGTTEGAVMLWALRRLDGYWDDGRIRSFARTSAGRMGGPFAKIAGCIGCTVDEALAGMWPQRRETSEDRLRDMEIVHRHLMALADDGTPMPDDP